MSGTEFSGIFGAVSSLLRYRPPSREQGAPIQRLVFPGGFQRLLRFAIRLLPAGYCSGPTRSQGGDRRPPRSGLLPAMSCLEKGKSERWFRFPLNRRRYHVIIQNVFLLKEDEGVLFSLPPL